MLFPECSLATFGTGKGVQRIPFVYLPLKGQIIHPSREIIFQSKRVLPTSFLPLENNKTSNKNLQKIFMFILKLSIQSIF